MIKRPAQRHRCYYFSDDGISWFETSPELRLKWNSLCRNLFKDGQKPTKNDYIKFINNHKQS